MERCAILPSLQKLLNTTTAQNAINLLSISAQNNASDGAARLFKKPCRDFYDLFVYLAIIVSVVEVGTHNPLVYTA